MPPLPAPPARPRRRLATFTDTVSCSWIFYSECPPASPPARSERDSTSCYARSDYARDPCNSSQSTGAEAAAPAAEPDPDLDSMHMMLDPHLRPISPDLNNDESKRIFEEHKQLAQEYLKIQTELAYLSKHKSELEEQMDDEELRQKREIIQLENEKDSLIKLYCSLKKQLRTENDSWLLPEDMPHE